MICALCLVLRVLCVVLRALQVGMWALYSVLCGVPSALCSLTLRFALRQVLCTLWSALHACSPHHVLCVPYLVLCLLFSADPTSAAKQPR